MIVTAQQDDTVDKLCHRHLGRTDILVDVLDRNPGLAAEGPILTAGTVVDLPDMTGAESAIDNTIIQLWD